MDCADDLPAYAFPLVCQTPRRCLAHERNRRGTKKEHYSLQSDVINQAITITASVTLVCYIMYTVSPETIANFHTENLYLTSVFVLLGLLRYIQIAVVDKKKRRPDESYPPRPFHTVHCIGLWTYVPHYNIFLVV